MRTIEFFLLFWMSIVEIGVAFSNFSTTFHWLFCVCVCDIFSARSFCSQPIFFFYLFIYVMPERKRYVVLLFFFCFGHCEWICKVSCHIYSAFTLVSFVTRYIFIHTFSVGCFFFFWFLICSSATGGHDVCVYLVRKAITHWTEIIFGYKIIMIQQPVGVITFTFANSLWVRKQKHDEYSIYIEQ